MAVTFTQQPSESELLPAYNNHIAIFTSALTNITHAILTIGVKTYKIYPDATGEFYYNFKPLFSKLINDNNFADDFQLVVDDTTQLDADLFQSITVTFTVYNAASNETIDKTFLVLKSVNQYKEQYEVLDLELEFFTPKKLTHWVGYPFDVSFYSEITTTSSVIYADGNSGFTQPFDIFEGVNRMTVDNAFTSINDLTIGWETSLTIDNGVAAVVPNIPTGIVLTEVPDIPTGIALVEI